MEYSSTNFNLSVCVCVCMGYKIFIWLYCVLCLRENKLEITF